MRILSILALASCTSHSFSRDDATAMAVEMSQLSLVATHASTDTKVTSLDQVIPCDSGSARIQGEVTGTVGPTGSGTRSVALTTTYTGCTIGDAVIDGDLAMTGMLTFDANRASGSVSFTGSFTASGQTCQSDFTVTVASAGPAPLLEGTICGTPLRITQH
jgi:hypothetical protein